MSAMGLGYVDFGTGATDASLVITGQTGFTAGTNLVEAFINPIPSSNNTDDNHAVENLEVRVTTQLTGTGFTIYVKCTLGTANGQYNVGWVWA